MINYTENDIRDAFKAGVTKGEHQSYFDAPLDEDEYILKLKKSKFIYRNEYPKCVENLWDKLPEEGQRVEVDYGNSTNSYVWFYGGKFVNEDGFEIESVLGWRPYN